MNEKLIFDFDEPMDTIAMMNMLFGQGIGITNRQLTPEELEAQRIRRLSIGQGILMVPTKDFEKVKDMGSYKDFCYLYKDGVKLSEIPFRQGGLFSGFGDNKYTNIIAYPELVKRKYSYGNHVIINTKGEIVLESPFHFDNPYYHKGVIASIKGTYYNLETKEAIVYGNATVHSENFLFVENKYNFGGGEKYDIGVYKIEYATGKYEIFK